MEESQDGKDHAILEEKFTMCRTDITKALQLCKAKRSSPQGEELFNTLETFKGIYETFESKCKLVAHNRFDFQLRQTVQTLRKELGAQLNIILPKLDTFGFLSEEAPTPPNVAVKNICYYTDRIIAITQKLSDDALFGDLNSFIASTKELFAASKELQQLLIQKNHDTANNLAQKIGKLSMMVIRTGKELCQHPNEQIKHEFSLAKQAFAQQLKEVTLNENDNTNRETESSKLPEGSKEDTVAVLPNKNLSKSKTKKRGNTNLTKDSMDVPLKEGPLVRPKRSASVAAPVRRGKIAKSSDSPSVSIASPPRSRKDSTPKKSRKKKTRRPSLSEKQSMTHSVKIIKPRSASGEQNLSPLDGLRHSEDSTVPHNSVTSPKNKVSLTYTTNNLKRVTGKVGVNYCMYFALLTSKNRQKHLWHRYQEDANICHKLSGKRRFVFYKTFVFAFEPFVVLTSCRRIPNWMG